MTVASSTRAGTNADSRRWRGLHWVPVGFAQGFLPLSDQLDGVEPMLAEKDASAPLLAEAVAAGEVFA